MREALKGAENEGAFVTEIFLPQYDIQFCTGCSKCITQGKCHIQDDFEKLKEIIYNADGIVWSSPTNAGSMNAKMKRFLERFAIFDLLTSTFGGKYMAGISVCGSMGAAKVAKELVKLITTGTFKKSFISGTLAIKTGQAHVSKNHEFLR